MEFMDSRAAYSGNIGELSCSHPVVQPHFSSVILNGLHFKRKELFFGMCYAVLGEGEILWTYVI